MKHDRLMTLLVLAAIVSGSGCARYAKQVSSTSPGYMASYAYQQRNSPGGTLFKADEVLLGTDSIEKILNARIELPVAARLAIMALHRQGTQGLWSPEAVKDEEAREMEVMEELRQAKRLADVSLLPTLLTPEKKGVPQLREAAARYQAHLLLVYQAHFNTFRKSRLLGTDEAKAYCVVEAALLDVRTGVVPFTSVSLQEYEVEKEKDDVNVYEASMRAELQAENMALKEIAQDLRRFLDGLP